MPARTVVLEKLVKFNGEGHADLTPGEYTQLTGRAGRRGIDIEGHAVVIWAPGMDPRTVAGLASRRTYPLRSSFRPSYNMAVNLVARMGREAAKTLLEQSFAQFQGDRAVVGMARQVSRNDRAIAELGQSMTCHLGDAGEYLRLVSELSAAEKAVGVGRLAADGGTRRSPTWPKLRRGDVIAIPDGRRAGLAVVLDPGVGSDGIPRPLVVTAGHWAGPAVSRPTSAAPSPRWAGFGWRRSPNTASPRSAATSPPRCCPRESRCRPGAGSPARASPRTPIWRRCARPSGRIRCTAAPTVPRTCSGPGGGSG